MRAFYDIYRADFVLDSILNAHYNTVNLEKARVQCAYFADE